MFENISLDVLSNITFDWAEVLDKVSIQTLSGRYIRVSGKNISWPPTPQFPSCQTLDLSHYLDVTSDAPWYIFFHLKKIENLGITLEIGDKRTSVVKRKLIANSFDYEGTIMELEDLWSTRIKTYALTFSQTINLEADEGKHCRHYPNEDFSSYRECDEKFVYDEVMKNFNIVPLVPFWAAKSIDEITENMYALMKVNMTVH